MALQMRNKRSVEFSMASMSDLVFLLLIFFMLTSTLVSPNAIKLLLPDSSSKTIAKQTIKVYINEHIEYYVETTPVNEMTLQSTLAARLTGEYEATVVLNADRSVPVQHVVNVIDAINRINESQQSSHKVILATKPSRDQ